MSASKATASPVSKAASWADVTGKPAAYPPAPHSHAWADITDRPTIPPASGRLELIGTVTVSQNVTLALALGMRRIDLTLSGVLATDRLQFATLTPCAAGCEAINVYVKAANQITVTYYTPALLIGAVISIPIAVYRVAA